MVVWQSTAADDSVQRSTVAISTAELYSTQYNNSISCLSARVDWGYVTNKSQSSTVLLSANKKRCNEIARWHQRRECMSYSLYSIYKLYVYEHLPTNIWTVFFYYSHGVLDRKVYFLRLYWNLIWLVNQIFVNSHNSLNQVRSQIFHKWIKTPTK